MNIVLMTFYISRRPYVYIYQSYGHEEINDQWVLRKIQTLYIMYLIFILLFLFSCFCFALLDEKKIIIIIIIIIIN